MPYAKKICGIYKIFTPSGNCYVGSSYNIFGRLAEHRMHLKNGTHHSSRLQAAWDKHGGNLSFVVLEECSRDALTEREQYWVIATKARLNATTVINNVWADDAVREKLMRIFTSTENKKRQSEVASRRRPGWVRVESDEGICFLSMAYAAAHYGVRIPGIAHLVRTQQRGKLGVRLKKVEDDWIEEKTMSQLIREAKIRNGTVRSEETKRRMSAAKKGIRPKVDFKALAEACQVPVIRIDELGNRISFPSVRVAAIEILNGKRLATVSAQISKCKSGVKKSAYGYRWEDSHAA